MVFNVSMGCVIVTASALARKAAVPATVKDVPCKLCESWADEGERDAGFTRVIVEGGRVRVVARGKARATVVFAG